MNRTVYSKRLTAMLLALSLLLTACGGGGSDAVATTMHLKRTEGTVAVSDGEGKDVEPKENLGLYSGYGVDTRSESYAWIDLDEVKLTKLDQDSEIRIQKDGKKLEIEVFSGSLFFNVTRPLAEDETMDICISTMSVGIRGTCGWVEVPDPNHMTLGLLEGTVECTAGTETAAVSAGELAKMSAGGEIAVEELPASAIPAFVSAELEEDYDLPGTIEDIELPEDLFDDPGDEQGDASRPTAYTEYWNEDTTPSARVEFTYEEGSRVRTDSYTWAGGSWTPVNSGYADATYNDQGREMEVLTYNSQGELVEYYILVWNWEDRAVYTAPVQGENKPSGYTDYYDAQGQRTRREYDDGGGEVTFEYDDRGRLAQTHIRTGTGAVAHHIFEYAP